MGEVVSVLRGLGKKVVRAVWSVIAIRGWGREVSVILGLKNMFSGWDWGEMKPAIVWWGIMLFALISKGLLVGSFYLLGSKDFTVLELDYKAAKFIC